MYSNENSTFLIFEPFGQNNSHVNFQLKFPSKKPYKVIIYINLVTKVFMQVKQNAVPFLHRSLFQIVCTDLAMSVLKNRKFEIVLGTCSWNVVN